MKVSEIATLDDIAAMERRLARLISQAMLKPEPEWITRAEAAKIMQCSLDTVDKWRRENPRSWKRVGNGVRIRRSELAS